MYQMMKRPSSFAALCLLAATLLAQPPSDDYPLGLDSKPQPGVPAGKTFYFDLTDSKIFPHTRRTITVYIPAAYQGDKPACVYVGLDGLGFGVPVVFDNLIAKKAIPVTIAIGVSSGTVDSAQPPDDPRFDRSLEFDSIGDRLPRFLVEEVLPEVERHKTPDSKPILLSTDPNERAIGGGSTGGIGAFNVAWQRPDQFRRVFTAIGTFVGMRGGEQFYVLVRKTEPKPLRIFMQDGASDEWGGGPEMGDWWMSNNTMQRALSFAGYDVNHVWGAGTHSDRHASALFPDVMRWLWRDYPKPIEPQLPGNPVLKAVLQEGSSWVPVAKDCGPSVFLNADKNGRVTAGPQSCPHPGSADEPFAYNPAGRRITADEERKVLRHDVHVTGLTVRANGDVYLTALSPDGKGQLWRIAANGTKTQLDTGLGPLSGIAFSPDGLWLMVARADSHLAYSYRVDKTGAIDAREPFYYVATEPGETSGSRAGAICMDSDGRPYMATDMGVQIFDRNGRVTAILPLPNHAPVSGISFGGDDWKTLYAAGGGVIYKRTLKVTGIPPWSQPVKLPKWGAG
jgi:gluconolactonase